MRDTAGFEVCMHCGFVNDGAAAHPFMLAPGTTLNGGRYLVGAAVNMTQRENWYAGYDLTAQSRVFIRELFPRELVRRGETSPEATPPDEESAQKFRAARERYLAEFRAVSGLSCRNLLSVYGLFEENGTAYAVTEYLEGLILSDFLAKNPAKPAASAAQNISLQLCAGLGALHNAGFVHAELGPDSVWMCENGAVKIAAYANMLLGGGAPAPFQPEWSPATAPPEAYRGSSLTQASDIYALASLIYRMFAGRFPQNAPERTAGGAYTALSSRGSGASSAAAAAVDRALSLKPKERFPSVHAFVAAFTGMEAEETTLDLSDKKPRATGKVGRIVGFAASALMMLAGAALIAAYFLYLT